MVLFQQQQLFESSLWLSRLLCCPLGFVVRGLSYTEGGGPSDSFLDLGASPSGEGAPRGGPPPPLGGPRGTRETLRLLYDSFFAQTLRAQKGILWGSSSSSSSSSNEGSSSREVGLCLREKDPDLGCPGLNASAYGDFDLTGTRKPMVNPGVYRAVCYDLSLGDSVSHL